jgi:tetratricopeptide (TPR) repeat protein
LGPNGIERRFSNQQIRDIFSTAVYTAGVKDPSVLHHFGLFESDSQNQDKAIDLVEEALRNLKQYNILPFTRTERMENLFNTLGVIHSRKGQAAETAGNSQVAESEYSVATDYFSKAKGGVSPNPHPYDSECRMHLYRAERTSTLSSKLVNYLAALSITDEAEDNLTEEDMPRILELKARIQEGMRNIGDRADIIAEFQQSGISQSEIAVIEARLTLLDETTSIDNLERAFSIVQTAFTSGNFTLMTLRTYTKLHRKLYPDDLEGLYKILKTRYQFPEERRNLSLLYELGRLSFTFEEYPKSREYFSALERISQGHPKRWGIRDRGFNRAGKIVEFSGTVVRFDSSNLGYVDFPQIKRQVPFLPYAQKYQPQVGENVTFKIGFNYRGWLAIDLSR